MLNSTAAFIHWPSAPFTKSLVENALKSLKNPPRPISALPDLTKDQDLRLLQWSTYDSIDHEFTYTHRERVLSSSYVYRKALIRKHFLSRCIHSYVTKQPASILKAATPRTYEIELSFVDDLEEMWTDELWELGQELEEQGTWWILKPGMADRGMGIRLFNSKEALEQIFQSFEDAESDQEEADENDTNVVTSQLRHFVVQEYISNPLVLDLSSNNSPAEGHKFHLRAYCVASGTISVYVCEHILALFASVPYGSPSTPNDGSEIDLAPHLTNTSLQREKGDENVRLLSELVGRRFRPGEGNGSDYLITSDHTKNIVSQIVDILGETFKAALQSSVHFQPMPNAFELYGVDFLVAHDPTKLAFDVKLLEFNAEPAIELTGPRLSWILQDLFDTMAKVCVEPWLSNEANSLSDVHGWELKETRFHLVKCLEQEVRGGGG